MFQGLKRLISYSVFGLALSYYVRQLFIGAAASYCIYALLHGVDFSFSRLVPDFIFRFIDGLSLDADRVSQAIPSVGHLVPNIQIPELSQLPFLPAATPDNLTLWIIANAALYPYACFGIARILLPFTSRRRRFMPILTVVFLKVILIIMTWTLSLPLAMFGLFALYFHHKEVEIQTLRKLRTDADAHKKAQSLAMEGRRYR